MKQQRTFKAVCLSVFIAIATSASSATLHADQKTRLAIVVAKDSPISGLSHNELKRLFLGSTVTGPGGVTMIAVNQGPESLDRAAFGRVVLGMSPDELGRYWIDRRIRGQSGPPKGLGSPAQVRSAVGHNPAVVGYLRENEIGPELKVIPIDGKTPKAPGYPVEF
jgi:hypothetical protein